MHNFIMMNSGLYDKFGMPILSNQLDANDISEGKFKEAMIDPVEDFLVPIKVVLSKDDEKKLKLKGKKDEKDIQELL